MFKSLTLFSLSIFIFCLNARSQAQVPSEDFTAMIERAIEEASGREAEPEAESEEEVITLRVLEAAEPAPEEPQPLAEVETSALNFEPIPEGFFDYAKFNELRNVRDYDSDSNKPFHIRGTSNRILTDIEENPARFTRHNGLRFFPGRSDMAPSGSPQYNDQGQRVFQISNNRADRRRNVIISVYYESITEVSAIKYPQSGAIQDVYHANLLLLSHSDSNGAFFTRVRVELDWSDLAGDDKGYVRVLSEPQTIPLSETDFEVYVDLGKQKTILKDMSEHNIKIVFAITTGGFDNRSSVDGVVGSLSLQMPRNLVSQAQLNENPELEYQEFNKETSFLVKRARWSNNRVNTETRTAPYFFNGRPFISIIDTRFVTRGEDGQLASNLHGGYRLVGFHDKIESDGLIRAAYSNGCLRTPDPDLYALDAILNHGPKDMIPVSAKMSQPEFSDFEPVLPRQNLYRQTILQVRDGSPNTARTVDCGPSTSDYTVKYYRGLDGRQYQTMVSSSCLTGMATVNQTPDRIVEYIVDKNQNGRAGFQAPASTIASREALHDSIQRRKEQLILRENYDRIPLFRPQFTTYSAIDSYITDYSLQAQRDKIDLIAQLESNDSSTLLAGVNLQGATSAPFIPLLSKERFRNFPHLSNAHWFWHNSYSSITTGRTDQDAYRINVPWYTERCAGRNARAAQQCVGVLRALNSAAQRINATIPRTQGGLF